MKEKRKNLTYRQKVRILHESDNQCSFCKFSDSGRLEFHHIDENPANTVLYNLIAVCPNCHSSIGEGEISMKEVYLRKKELEKVYRKKAKSEKSYFNFQENTLNNPVIGNNNSVTINVKKQITKKTLKKYPDNSIGQNVLMYGYSKYLADRYSEFKEYDLKRKQQKFNYASFYGKVKKDFRAGGFFHIPQTRFFELVDYLQKRIDRTVLAKINLSKGIDKNYISFNDYKIENKLKE